MSVSGIEALDFTPYVAPAANTAINSGGDAGSSGFADMLIDGIDRLQGVQAQADGLAVQAATGDLENLHDYTIAATEASVTTQMTVALRNKAVEAFTEIMRMQV